jgi:hypothetical protein
MTDEQINDLKDFFLTALDNAIEEVRAEMHAGFQMIAEIIDRHNDQLDDHDKRIGKLESKLV